MAILLASALASPIDVRLIPSINELVADAGGGQTFRNPVQYQYLRYDITFIGTKGGNDADAAHWFIATFEPSAKANAP
jgi:hypothetical protein